MEEQRFKVVVEGKFVQHSMDQGGNHFIDGKCVNPKRADLVRCEDNVWRHPDIGSSYPENGTEIYPVTIKNSRSWN